MTRGVGIKVTVTNTKSNKVLEAVFHDFPITIGRSETVELSLDEPVISKEHAQLGLVGNRICVTDLGSRNGTLLGSGVKVEPRGLPTDLAPFGNAFTIAHLIFKAELVNTANREKDDRSRNGFMLSGRYGTTPVAELRPKGEAGREARAAIDDLKPDYDAMMGGVERFRERLKAKFEVLEPENRTAFIRGLACEQPELTNDPLFQSLAARLSIYMVELRSPDKLRVEEAAHRVLQELAEWYGVPSTMASIGEVIRFGRKIQDVCDALFSSVIPLRDGLKIFGERFGIQHGRPQNEVMAWLDRARTEQDVGAALLNSTITTGDSWVAVRAICSDYMMNLISLPAATMEGVQALLHELAPSAIESQAADAPWYARTLFRAETLWTLYARRYDDLASEQGEAFSRLFGNEFAAMYDQMFKSGKAEDAKRAQERQARVRPVLAGQSRTEERPVRAPGAMSSSPPPAPGTVVMRRTPNKSGGH